MANNMTPRAFDPAQQDWTGIEEFRNNEMGMTADELRVAFDMPLSAEHPSPPCLAAEAEAWRARRKDEQS